MDGNIAQDLSQPIQEGKLKGWTALMLAAHGRDPANIRPQILLQLLDLGADPTIRKGDKDCLFSATATGCTHSVAALLSTGKFNPFDKDTEGKNLEFYARHCNKYLKEFLEKTYGMRLESYVSWKTNH